MKKLEEAIYSFNKTIEIQFDYDNAWYKRGITLLKLWKYREAIASYKQAIKIRINNLPIIKKLKQLFNLY
jgi:tetratricopeptide (TPR) repeat protein